MNKPTTRSVLLARRRSLAENDVRKKSRLIAANMTELIDWPNITHVHLYRSAPEWREVETDWLVPYVVRAWPHIKLTIGNVSKTAELPTSRFDLIVVPLVGFDTGLNRLGMGGGWYDRFLSTQPRAITVGLAFELQYVAHLAVEPHDMPLHHIVTETRILTRSASRQ